jgi:hypothetical protein
MTYTFHKAFTYLSVRHRIKEVILGSCRAGTVGERRRVICIRRITSSLWRYIVPKQVYGDRIPIHKTYTLLLAIAVLVYTILCDPYGRHAATDTSILISLANISLSHQCI